MLNFLSTGWVGINLLSSAKAPLTFCCLNLSRWFEKTFRPVRPACLNCHKNIWHILVTYLIGPSKSFCRVQIISDRSQLYKLFHKSLIWTWPKLFGPNQNVSDLTKTIWMIQNLFGHKEGQSLNFIISGVENLIIWQFWWLVELQGLFHGCQHTLLTQLKLECKEMVLAKTRSSKVPCTVSELQSQVSKEVYILICFGLSTFNKTQIYICSI